MGVSIATNVRDITNRGHSAWVSRKNCIPIAMYPCRAEERLTIELVEGREVEKIVTTMTKNGVVTRYPGKFHEYQLTDKGGRKIHYRISRGKRGGENSDNYDKER
ncbi:hypothetical protein Tco_1468769, partial [Tanacetum coccineum]